MKSKKTLAMAAIALALFTLVNGHCVAEDNPSSSTGEETTAEERQTSFRDMMELALEVAVRS